MKNIVTAHNLKTLYVGFSIAYLGKVLVSFLSTVLYIKYLRTQGVEEGQLLEYVFAVFGFSGLQLIATGVLDILAGYLLSRIAKRNEYLLATALLLINHGISVTIYIQIPEIWYQYPLVYHITGSLISISGVYLGVFI